LSHPDLNLSQSDLYNHKQEIESPRPESTQVGSVYASDQDSGSYADIQYSLTGQGAGDFLMFTSNKKEVSIFHCQLFILMFRRL
jgi:hypothetical protein